MVLTDRMQTDNGDFIAIEDSVHAHSLRQTVRTAGQYFPKNSLFYLVGRVGIEPTTT